MTARLTDDELIALINAHADRRVATLDVAGAPFHDISTVRLSAPRNDGVERKIILWLDEEPLDDFVETGSAGVTVGAGDDPRPVAIKLIADQLEWKRGQLVRPVSRFHLAIEASAFCDGECTMRATGTGHPVRAPVGFACGDAPGGGRGGEVMVMISY